MYPPEGLRGCGPRRSSSYGLESADYFATANQETLVIGQIETLQAVENLDKILETKALDCIFVGPSDLATSQGYVGQARHPENLKTIERILEIGRAHRVPVGIYSLGPEWNMKLIEQGFKFIAIASTESLFILGVREVLDKIGRGRAKR
jgi:2-dehydro-3-deoxyglucarate aldolase